MITLTEKRLQELEQRIPVLLADIAEKQKKMQEIYTFPNDLAEMRKVHENLSKLLKDHVERSMSGFDAFNQKSANLDQRMASLSKGIEDIQIAIGNFKNAVDGHIAGMTDVRAKVHALIHTVADTKSKDNLEASSLKHDALIEDLSKAVKSAHAKINGIGADSAYALNKLKNHADKIDANSDELMRVFNILHGKIDQKDKDISDLREKISQVDQKAVQNPRDYDSQIGDIKKDLASILTVVHTTASASPDTSKLDAKIKVMENNLAQIYALLKKYEPQA